MTAKKHPALLKKRRPGYVAAVEACELLTEQDIKFVDTWMADPLHNGAAAARAAGVVIKGATRWACEKLKDPRVIDLIRSRRAGVRSTWEAKPEDVVADAVRVLDADPREVVEVVVTCCRHCHGYEFRYQSTPAEYRANLAKYLVDHPLDDPVGAYFPIEGGVGYDARKAPRPECPECHGYGVPRVVLHDTRFLSHEARAMYAGAKHGKHGIEVILRDKDAARALLARNTGVIPNTKSVNVQHTGPGGGPVQHAVLALTVAASVDPQEAARQYVALMGGG